MSWSLSEIDALARKAARGAGFSWGMAEEAGHAVRWLASVSLPGPEALLARLDAGVLAPLLPGDADWRAEAGPLCPLVAGTALSDRAGTLDHAMTLYRVAQPVLLIPFLAGVAAQTGTSLQAYWIGGHFSFGADVRGTLDMAGADAAETADVSVGPGTVPELPPLACQLRYDLPVDISAGLGRLAHLTYAPETDERRLAGAGAGLSDND